MKVDIDQIESQWVEFTTISSQRDGHSIVKLYIYICYATFGDYTNWFCFRRSKNQNEAKPFYDMAKKAIKMNS